MSASRQVWRTGSVGAAFLVALALACGSDSHRLDAGKPLPDAEARQALAGLTAENAADREAALQRIEAAPDRRFVAPLIELVRTTQLGITPQSGYNRRVVVLEHLTRQALGGDWFGWAQWQSNHPLPVPPGFASWKGKIFATLDPHFAKWLRDDQPARLRVQEIDWGGVRVDGIPPLDQPRHVSADEADFMDPAEPVVGLAFGGEARAYPLRILDWHELVNDRLGGVPFALSYCSLCGSAIPYEARVEGAVRRFGTSGLLYRSNKLMWDRKTDSLWSQLTGEAVLGPAAKAPGRLTALPSVVTRWADWRVRHPETSVVSLATGYKRDYALGQPYGGYFMSPQKLFPTSGTRQDLPQKERVFGLYRGGRAKAWSLARLTGDIVRNDSVGGEPVVLVAQNGRIEVKGRSAATGFVRYDAGAAVRAYRRPGGPGQHFRLGPKKGVLVEEKSGASWQIGEAALVGPDGQRAPRIPGTLAYWFAWQAFHPQTEVVGTVQTP